MSKSKANSNDLGKMGFSFDLNPEDFDKMLAAELQSMDAVSGSFRTLNHTSQSSVSSIEKSSNRSAYQSPQQNYYVPSSSSGYMVGKSVPGAVTMLPSKLLKHDENFKRIHTAKTTVTDVSDPDFDPSAIDEALNDPSSDVNYNSSGNNVFVLSCNALTSMPVVPREGGDGKKLSTPQLKKQVNERYAEVQSLFAPPTTLTQHDVDVLNITIEAKRYEEFYEASVVDPMEQINLSHEITMQKHVERLKKPKGYVPFGASSPLPHFSMSAPSSLSPIRGGKRTKKTAAGNFSDSESQGSSYTSPLNKLKTIHAKAKSPRSPILTVDAFTEVADKMKEDIKSLVQDTIRSELMNMRKKQSRGGNIYIEPTTPNNDNSSIKEGDSGSVRRQQQQQQQQQQRGVAQLRNAATPDTLEQVIERKIEGKLQQLNQELSRLRNKPDELAQAKPTISPVKPPLNAGSPKAAAPNTGRKLKEGSDSTQTGKNAKAGPPQEGGSVKFSDMPENIPTDYAEPPRSQPTRRMSGQSVTFSSDSPTPIMSAQSPYSNHYNRNFSITPGGSLIHSFIDENREYAGANYDAYTEGTSARRRSSGSKDFVSVSTPSGPNIFGTTPGANAARLSSPAFSSEMLPPQSPALLDNRVSSPRSTSRQALALVAQSPLTSAPGSNQGSNGNRSRTRSQATPPDHVDAVASEVTIQVVPKADSPVEKRKSTDVNPNLKVKIGGVVLEDSSVSGAASGRRKKNSVSGSPKAPSQAAENSVDKGSTKVPNVAASVSSKGAESPRNDIELMLLQKLNEVLMAPVPSDVVQPPVVQRSSKRLSVGTVQRQTQSRELVGNALQAATASVLSSSAKAAPVTAPVEDVVSVESAVAPPIVEKPAAIEEITKPVEQPVVVVQKPVIPDTKNATVAAVINGRPLPTKEVVVPLRGELSLPSVKASGAGAPVEAARVTEKPVDVVPAPAATPAVAAPVIAPSTMAATASSKAETPVESIAAVRDAMKSAAGLGSRAKTSDIMAQYDKEQKQEEDALLYGTGYGNDAIMQILKKFEKNDGVEVDLSAVEKLSEREAEVLDAEYNELTKQIAQLSKIKSKIKKDLKTWVSDFEVKEGRPPSTADKLTIEDRFLAYKTVVTEVEEAKRYSNKIAELLKASR